MNAYTVSWETKPAPGATFYSGARRIFADTDADAVIRGLREISRDMMLSPSSIRILKVERQVQP